MIKAFILRTALALTLCFGFLAAPAAQAATATGTEVDFTGLTSPTTITVAFKGVSTNGASDMLVQLGSGSYATTGYSGGGTNGVTTAASTAGFVVNVSTSAGVISGNLTLKLVDAGTNLWVVSGTFYDANDTYACMTAGYVVLSGAVDRARVTTVNGTDSFDAGILDIVAE